MVLGNYSEEVKMKKSSITLKMPRMVCPILPYRLTSQVADSVIAEEIANLRKEAQALKEIRQSMGSTEFSRKVFEKVFKEDIDRLRGMEDMWKSRKPPEPLDFDKLEEESSSIETTVSNNDQKVWSLAEDFVVFKYRYERFCQRAHVSTTNPWTAWTV